MLEKKLNRWRFLLLPLSYIFVLIVFIRRAIYRLGLRRVIYLEKPIIVVGNIILGGTGKTPLSIYLAHYFAKQGFKVGVVCKGYGGKHQKGSLCVNTHTPVDISGDEAKLIKEKTNAIVVVNKNRAQGAKSAIMMGADIIISDDGLQHYKMHRDIEIILIDSARGIGNGLFLPAGILRESTARLLDADFLIYHRRPNQEINIHKKLAPYLAGDNVFEMRLLPLHFINVKTRMIKTLTSLQKTSKLFYALAAIANSEGFFSLLKQSGFMIREKSFPDHYRFTVCDFKKMHQYPVLMTEKDAVKCTHFAHQNMWCLAVKAELSSDFLSKISTRLDKIT